MRFLVDANVLSEPTRPAPDEKVVNWLGANEARLVVDPIILGEIRFGILLLAAGAKRRSLETWFARGVQRLECVPWDAAVGLEWAQLLSRLRAAGAAMPIKDSMIAATAALHGFTVATRNENDFKKARVPVLNPFIRG
jgi:predicted nucleic acid-binding protein